MKNLTKADMKKLPKINGNEFKESCAYYTELIFTKTDKREAFKKAFPDKYQLAIERACGNPNLIEAKIKKGINQVESSAFMQECFYAANKHWWMKFIHKKNDIYEKVYDTATDDTESTRDRLNAAKIFLQFAPDTPKEEKITVEVKVGSDEFKNMLLEKKKQIHNAANESIEDVEVIDE